MSELRVIAESLGLELLDNGEVRVCIRGAEVNPRSVAALLADLYRRMEKDFEERLEDIVVAAYERIEAVERYQEHCMRHVARQERQRQDTNNRVAALEQALGGTQKVGERALITETRDALESRQQDEAGEGEADQATWFRLGMKIGRRDVRATEVKAAYEAGYEQCVFDDEKRIRRELAREIVERLRGDDVEGLLWSKRSLADWIER